MGLLGASIDIVGGVRMVTLWAPNPPMVWPLAMVPCPLPWGCRRISWWVAL